jgi:hypothetical protein
MLTSPPTEPEPEPVTPVSNLPFPGDETTYNTHLQRQKCDLLTGSNNLATVRKII